MRKTHTLVQVALALMADPSGRHWGYELTKQAGIRSGALYPVLHRMLGEGWLVDGWEDREEVGKRPPRRYYELTGDGIEQLGGLLAEAKADARFKAVTTGLAW